MRIAITAICITVATLSLNGCEKDSTNNIKQTTEKTNADEALQDYIAKSREKRGLPPLPADKNK